MATNGQVMEPVAKATSDLAEIGSTGLKHYGGYIVEEFRRELRGKQGIATYLEMMTYPVIGASLLAIDNLVRRVPWEFDPPEDPGADGERWTDLCNESLHDMSHSWSDTVSSIFSFVPLGWSYHNVVLKRRNGEQPDRPGAPPSSDYDDGLVGWRKIELRAQESLHRWEFDKGSLRGMWQQTDAGVVLIPIEKSALFRASSRKFSPEAPSVLRSAYEPWWYVRKIKELEAVGIERDLAGLPVVGVPPDWLGSKASDEQKAAVKGLKNLLTNIRRNSMEGALVPRDLDDKGNDRFSFGLLASAGRRQLDINQTISRYNQEMALAVLTDWLLLGQTAVGSRALADPKMDMFMTALETWTNLVCDVFNSHVTPRLMRANGVPGNRAPQLRAGKVRQTDLLNFAQAMGELISSGAVTQDRDTEAYIREETGLPPQMEPEDVEDEPVRAPLLPEDGLDEEPDETEPEEPEMPKVRKRWRRAA